MECKNCKTVNSDDAVFCKNCGTRLDGKKNCPSCGAVIEEDSVYCNACGARVDGKVVCKNCGTAHEGAFCPQCGSKNQGGGVKAEKRARASRAEVAIKTSRILNYVSLGLVLAVAVLAIIFVCLMGVTISAQDGESMSLGIFDYFGKEIQEVKDELSAGNYFDAYKDALYLPAILGLISMIVSLAGTVFFAIMGALKAIQNLTGKNGKSATVWALLAFVFYMFGVSMMMSINAASMSMTSSGVSVSTGVEFNKATVAGIVLCTVMAAGAVGCDATAWFMKEKLNAFKIVERVLAVVLAAGAVIVVAMFASPVATWINKTTYEIYYENSTVTIKMGMGILSLFALYMNNYKTEVSQSAVGDVNLMETYAILGQLCIFIALIAALLFFVTVLGKDGKKSRCLSVVSSAIFFVSTLIALIMTVLAGNKILPIIKILITGSGVNGTNKMTYAPVIVALVFAALTFAGNICRVVFGAKGEAKTEESAVSAE